MKYIMPIIIVLYCVCIAAQPTTDPTFIAKKCIEQHGGWDKFAEIRDIYAKMDVISYSDDGKFAVTLHEYFRKPDKLRVEMYSDAEPPVIMGWDGATVYQLTKEGKIEQSQEPEQVERIQESLRFIRMLILTNLLAEDSKLEYVKYQKKEEFGIHILAQVPKDGGDKILIFISDTSYTLLGAQFAMRDSKGAKNSFKVMFKQHEWYKGMYLPMQTELYHQSKLVMEASLRLAKTNSLENGNTFFTNLLEESKFTRTEGTHRRP